MTIDKLGTFSARPERVLAAENATVSVARPLVAAKPAAETKPATAGAPDSTPKDELAAAVSKLNESVHEQSISFEIDEESKRTIVKVIDTHTKEVVRQMPTEEALQIAKSLDKAFGLLIRQQA
ncbi:flagellar protein FlaG [Massilia sp. METH4]|uniref:flagellar protein FlaG n=1 Tax=Massilia sp. METH4 TaxID=3123041 RepID=UPI0030CC9045